MAVGNVSIEVGLETGETTTEVVGSGTTEVVIVEVDVPDTTDPETWYTFPGQIGQNAIGNVTIEVGLEDPSVTLVDEAAGGVDVGKIEAHTSTYSTSGPNIANGVLVEGMKSGGVAIAATDSAGMVSIFTGGTTEKVRIDQSGKVGIGTSSAGPSARLELKQPSDAVGQGIRITRAAENTWGEFYISASNHGLSDPLTLRHSYNSGTDAAAFGRDGQAWFGSHVTLENGKYLHGKNSSGTTKQLIGMNGSNLVTIAIDGQDVLMGTGKFTHSTSSDNGVTFDGPGDGKLVANYQGIASANTQILFLRGSVSKGSITSDANGTYYNSSSDARRKRNIRNTNYGLADLMKIEVRDYEPIEHDKTHTGFLAQQLASVFPEAVSEPKDPNEPWGLDYGRLTPLLVKALQDLVRRVEALESK